MCTSLCVYALFTDKLPYDICFFRVELALHGYCDSKNKQMVTLETCKKDVIYYNSDIRYRRLILTSLPDISLALTLPLSIIFSLSLCLTLYLIDYCRQHIQYYNNQKASLNMVDN